MSSALVSISRTLPLLFMLLFLSSTSFSADRYDFVVAKDIVKQVRKKFKSFNSYTADFSIQSRKGKKTSNRTGKIFFRKPDKVRMIFTYPRAQIVVSNGEKVWIYMPRLKILGEQDLNKTGDDSFFSKASPVGLDRLFSLYHYSFKKGKQPQSMQLGNLTEDFFVLELKQKVMTSGFRSMEVWVDKNYLIRHVRAENALGKIVTMSFTNIVTGKDLDDSLFVFNRSKYKIKSVVKNPLVQP